MAKYFGVEVQKFSLGFGPKLTGKKIGETEYLISMIPLGGYVKMLGENDDIERLPYEERERSFSNQHVLKRIAIVVAGPIFNLFLALLIFCCFYMIAGQHIMTTEIGQVTENMPAYKAGLLKEDIIISIDGEFVESWSDIRDIVQSNKEKPLKITVERDGGLLTFSVIPEESSTKNFLGEPVKSFLIGIVASAKTKTIELGLYDALKEGIKKTWEIIFLTCLVIVKLFQGIVSIKTLGGPILIGQMTGQLAQENMTSLIPFMAVISINLGILNLLPVPILDGGLIVFLFIELFLGRPPSIKIRETAQKVGLFLLIILMVIVIYNDVGRLLE